MKKIFDLQGTVLFKICSKKTLKIMKLTSFLLFVTMFSVFGSKTYSQYARLNLNMTDASIQNVLTAIEEQSEFFFLYSSRMIDVSQKVNIHVESKNVNEVLDEMLSSTNIKYDINDRQILLVNKESDFAKKIQQKTISGVVSDKNGPIPGANVVATGTTTGTITDSNGKYTLAIPQGAESLTFTFIGMESQEITIGTLTQIDLLMVESAIGLDEVVVVGYGTQKKVNLTGSVSSVGNDIISKAKNSDIVNMVAGKLPGLRVKQSNSEPGQYNTHFDIRGWDSPLIIVDGVERPNWNRMSANEIESINILKDASAAIYGVKAANGVILVTTKSGTKNQSNIVYTSSFGTKKMTNFPKTLSLYEFATLTNENSVNLGNPPGFSEELLQQYKDGTIQGADWGASVMRDLSPMTEHNLTFSGGTEKVTYFATGAYMYEQGLWKTGDLNYKRYNLRSNVTAEITNNLKASLQISGISDVKKRPSGGRGTSTIIRSIWFQQPTLSIYANDNPDYLSVCYDGTHPVALTNSAISGYNNIYYKSFTSNFNLDYNIPFVDGLMAKMLFAFDYDETYTKNWRKKFKLYTYDAVNDIYNSKFTDSPSQLTESNQALNKTTLQLSLNYQRTFNNKHNVKVLGLFEQRQFAINNFSSQREFSMDALDELYAGSSSNQVSYADPNNIYELANQGFVGRFNYDYKGNYLVEAGFRYDGSSKFAQGARWGFFPYASAGWRISEENFMDFLDALDDLKLRVSHGILGDDAASRFQFLSGYSYPSSGYVINSEFISGLGFLGMPNPNITWFTSATTNIGLDASLWKRKLYFNLDVFRRFRDGLLATRLLSLPGSVGSNLSEENLESDLSSGYEIVLGHKNTINDFTYDISVNYAFTRTKWVDKEEPVSGNSYLNWQNSQVDRYKDIWWGYNQIGQFTSQEDIYNSPIQDNNGNRDILPGDFKYLDLNEDGIINEMDREPVGYGTIPDINYGINITMSWKGLDFYALFQGLSHFNSRYGEMLTYPLPWGQNGLSIFMDRWHRSDPFDPESEWISGKYPSTRIPTSVPWNYYDSNFWINNATFLRLKSVELGYSFPENWIKNLGIQNLRVYANGYNVFLLSKILSGIDPEVPSSGSPYPIFKNFNFGITINF